MNQLRRIVLAAVLAGGLPGIACAQAPAAEASCVTYDAAYEKAPLMKIGAVPGGKVYLQDQARACAAQGRCGWRRAGYLTAGDVVFASAPRAGFRCVYFGTSAGKLIAGFVPAAALQPTQESGAADAAFLAGRWGEDGGARITFARAAQGMTAKGTASYGDNSGEFSGPVKPAGRGFSIADGDCRVEGRRRGPYLVVSDNNGCGGMNVSFGGIYSRLR
jgi:hypothetical protein